MSATDDKLVLRMQEDLRFHLTQGGDDIEHTQRRLTRILVLLEDLDKHADPLVRERADNIRYHVEKAEENLERYLEELEAQEEDGPLYYYDRRLPM